MKRTLLFLVAAATLFSLATPSFAQNRDQISPKAQERITREVRHELLMLPYFGVFDNIAFPLRATSGGSSGRLGWTPTLRVLVHHILAYHTKYARRIL